MIKRQLYSALKNHLSKPEITLLVGPRQAGKTTLMMKLKQDLDLVGKKTLFLSLDNDLDRPHFKSQSALINKIKLEIGQTAGFVFIDEIQRRENAGLFLKGVYDRKLPYKFIISGSGSVELKEKVHESLVGRKQMFELGTLTFVEFVNFKTEYVYEQKLETFFKTDLTRSRLFLQEYLNFGGYPRVVLAGTELEKQAEMTEIYQSYLEKDISSLLCIKKTEKLTQLVRILASQAGGMVSFSELSATLGLAVATINNYIWYLEKTFILKKITPFFKNIRKEITKKPLYYFHDLGIKNYAQKQFGTDYPSQNNGHQFENFVVRQLFEKIELPNTLHFWRTTSGAEVDFVIDRGLTNIPIEVKFTNLKKPTINRSLRSFIEKYQPEVAYVVHLGKIMRTQIESTKVIFVPFSYSDFLSASN